jgi:HEAT repeat protein
VGLFKPNIAKLKENKDIDQLIKALSDRRESVRKSAADALGALKDNRAVDALISALGECESVVSMAAAESLGEIGDAKAVEPLIAVLNKPFTGGKAAEALRKISWVSDEETKQKILRKLGPIPSRDIGPTPAGFCAFPND